MASNRGIAYVGPGKVEVRSIDFPKLIGPGGRRCDHGVILKIVTTNICGSDQHMVRGRTTAPVGLVLGHEILGEIVEKGNDVETLSVGDLVTVVGTIEELEHVTLQLGEPSDEQLELDRGELDYERTFASNTKSAGYKPGDLNLP